MKRAPRWRNLTLRQKLARAGIVAGLLAVLPLGMLILLAELDQVQPTRLRLSVLAGLGALTLFGAVMGGWSSVRAWSRGTPPPIATGSPRALLGSQLVLTSLLVWILYREPGIADLIGFSRDSNPWLGIGCGLIAYALVVAIAVGIARLFGVHDKIELAAYTVMRRLWPRRPRDHRPFLIAVCLLNPLTEEILFRGVLVSWVAHDNDSTALGIAVGLGASLAAHLYQGWRLMPFHLLFHGTAIALLLSPLGLTACIAMHVAGDIVPMVRFGRVMRQRRDRLRNRRQFAGISRTA